MAIYGGGCKMNKTETSKQEKLFNTENEYSKARFTNSFNSEFEGRTWLIGRMWELNDFTNYKFGQVKMLLEILDIKESVKMSKGLNTIADNFERMANELREFTKEKQIKDVEVMGR
jgi:hypothetical protein